ncbi:MAG: glycoside hydrolase family 127 protein, partial [Duncaniella sp.]|nr:glycoside hydrolase family 127 protein [Duncaniella sp.]
TLWCNLYGDNELRTSLGKKRPLVVKQTTEYPFDGLVELTMVEVPKKEKFALKLRVPSWCDNGVVTVNGVKQDVKVTPDTYITLDRVWKAGDKVTFDMEMRTKLLESNPLVEETRNHTAIKRGPLVYCLESIDIEGGKALDDILIPSDAKFTTKEITIDGSKITALETEARLADNGDWSGKLYREVGAADKNVKVTLIPYYAWGNRDKAEMSVWLPLAR